jgi:DNA polymerase-3 subunit beta
MKLICERDALRSALSHVASRARNKLKIPVLEHVKIETADKALSLAATDLSTFCAATIPAEVSAAGATTVSADRLSRLAEGMPMGSQVTLDLHGNDLHVVCGRSRYKLPTLPAQDFPEMVKVENGAELTLTVAEAKRLLGDAASAMPANDSRIYLFGAFLSQRDKDHIMVTSTDGIRLARAAVSSNAKLARGYLIPRPALPELLKLAALGDLAMRFNDNVIEVSAGNVVFTSKLIDATFPDMDKIIPRRSPTFIEVARWEFASAIKRLVGLEDENSTINISWTAGAAAIDIGLTGNGTGTESVACKCDINAGDIAFRPNILSEMLDVGDGDTIQLHISGPNNPMLIIDADDPDLTVIAMPCKARG